MDGVLSDILGALIYILNKETGKKITFESYLELGGGYDVGSIYGISNEELWSKIVPRYKKFWLEMPTFTWTQKLYDYLKSIGDVTIVSKPTKDPKCSSDKLIWLEKVLSISRDDVFLGAKKYLMAGNGILIDDYPKNIEEFREHGGQAILVPSNWNTPNLTFNSIKNVINKHLEKWEQKNT